MGCTQASPKKITSPGDAGKTLLTSHPTALPMHKAVGGKERSLRGDMPLPAAASPTELALYTEEQSAAVAPPAGFSLPPPTPPTITFELAKSADQVNQKSAVFGTGEVVSYPSPLRSSAGFSDLDGGSSNSVGGSFVSSYTAISNFSFGPRLPQTSSRSALSKHKSASRLDPLQEDAIRQEGGGEDDAENAELTARRQEDQFGRAVESAVHTLVDVGENLWNRAEDLWQSMSPEKLEDDDEKGSRRKSRRNQPWVCNTE